MAQRTFVPTRESLKYPFFNFFQVGASRKEFAWLVWPHIQRHCWDVRENHAVTEAEEPLWPTALALSLLEESVLAIGGLFDWILYAMPNSMAIGTGPAVLGWIVSDGATFDFYEECAVVSVRNYKVRLAVDLSATRCFP